MRHADHRHLGRRRQLVDGFLDLAVGHRGHLQDKIESTATPCESPASIKPSISVQFYFGKPEFACESFISREIAKQLTPYA